MIDRLEDEEFVLERSNDDINDWRVCTKSCIDSPGLKAYRYFKSEKEAREYINREIEDIQRTLRRIKLGWSEQGRFTPEPL